MRAARAIAWTVFGTIAIWSVWFFLARWIREQCWNDGCAAPAPAGHASIRYALWLTGILLGFLAVSFTSRRSTAGPVRIILTSAVAAACFVGVLTTLGDVLPPHRPPTFGE